MKTLDIATAFMHADTLARRFDPRAHLYLDLAEALIEGPDERVIAARERCIVEYEIPAYSTCPDPRDDAATPRARHVESYVEGEVWVCDAHLRGPAHPRFRPAPGWACDRCVEAARGEE